MSNSTICGGCPHVEGLHLAAGACRINGCPCREFIDPAKRSAGPREVVLTIPEGYMLTIQLTPLGEEPQMIVVPPEAASG